MDIKEKIKSYLQQAEIYHKQGLLAEAKQNYARAGQLIKKNERVLKNKKILADISKKILQIKEEIERIDSAPTTVEMPEKVQNIIMDKFAFAKDQKRKSLEGAVALAKFGQFERALKEFNSLIQVEVVKLEAAKNIIRCHKVLETVEQAVEKYHEWYASKTFTASQMKKLKIFLQDILDKKGINLALPLPDIDEDKADEEPIVLEQPLTPEPKPAESVDDLSDGIPMPEELAKQLAEEPEPKFEPEPVSEPEPELPPANIETEIEDDEEGAVSEEDLIDISSVEITLDEGTQKGKTVELDVSFQSGNVINLLISSSDTELIETLKTGLRLNKLQFYSPIAMFTGKGIVASNSKIQSGPKQGDYSLDIKIKTM